MKKHRVLPSRLAELRERDPARFLKACRRGGRNSAEKRKKAVKSESPTLDEKWAEVGEMLALKRKKQAIKEARHLAFQRGDHLLPDP